MYRKGLTVGQIADLCGAVPQTVSKHIRAQRALHLEMQAHYAAEHPPKKARPLPSSWLRNIDALHIILTVEGRYPTTSDPEPRRRRLGSWLSVQRRANREGRLSQAKLMALQSLGGWTLNQRIVEQGRRWQERLQELRALRQHEGRWSRHREYETDTDTDTEHIIGVWLQGQRQKALKGALAAKELQALNETVPGWNTWKSNQRMDMAQKRGWMNTQRDHMPRFLTVEQVAEELNVGVPQIRALLKSGELRGIQVGGKNLWRIGRTDVEAYIGAAYEQTAQRIATGEVNGIQYPVVPPGGA